MTNLRYLLLQIRDADDPMRAQEVDCFCHALECDPGQLATFDLLSDPLTTDDLRAVDAVLIGGSGNYSAAEKGADGDEPWLQRILTGLRLLHAMRKPTFASCWGFQALARAMGGRCIHDPDYAELGTVAMHLTPAGREDPLFGELTNPFVAHSGHEDHVVQLPPDTVLLASSDRVAEQAFKFVDVPIYCTQFHPELDRQAFVDRITTYPQYVERIAGTTLDNFRKRCQETPEANRLLKRFAELVVEHR